MNPAEWVVLAVVVLGIVIAIFGLDRYRGSRKSAGTGSGSEPTDRGLHRPGNWPAHARLVQPGVR